MRQIQLHDDAIKELWDAVDYYELQRLGLGLDFEREVSHGMEAILESPLRWPAHIEGTRRYILHKFPFSIVYLELLDVIWVVAIAHQKRHPVYWLDRMD